MKFFNKTMILFHQLQVKIVCRVKTSCFFFKLATSINLQVNNKIKFDIS